MKTSASDKQPSKIDRPNINSSGMHSSRRTAIKNLGFVLSGGVGGALLLACFMLYYYGPSGTYFVRNVLLSPSLISSLAYQERSSRTGKMEKYTFEGIHFIPAQIVIPEEKNRREYDRKETYAQGNNLQTLPVSLDQYKQFYKLIENDVSISPVTEELLLGFSHSSPAVLRLNVVTGADIKVFQEVAIFPEGDYYRIMLRQDNAGDRWAYYRHPHLYEQTLRLFTGKS